MKAMALLLSVSVCALALSGCGAESRAPAPAPTPSAAPTRSAAPVAAPAAVDPDFGLELDSGQKWQVDEHVRASSMKMTALLDDATDIDSVDDARALGSALNEEITSLIQGCTMTGPAHDELHVLLVELFPRVDSLKAQTDLAQLKRAREELGLLFDAYERHFE